MHPLASRLLLSALLPAFLPTLAAAQAATVPTPTAVPVIPAASYLAGALVNDARDALRDPALPPAAAAAQATVLLQFAGKLEPTDLRALHLLAQTAQAAGNTPVRRAALRQIIAADPRDLVAQVQYIDVLADESQKAEDRIAVYQGMMAQTELDAQVRSEIALRLARLAEARGDAALGRDYLAQAVKLNDVNVGALRDLVRRAAAEPPGPDAFAHHLQALVTLLLANPYQPDAWLQVARVLQAAGVHDRAAEFLDTAADQFRVDGTPPAGDLYLDLAVEFALAGRLPKARDLSAKLANLPDAPLAALLIDELLAQQNIPASASPLASQPASRATEIRQRLAELAKDPENASALADAAGADLTLLPVPGPDTPAWIEAYAKLVAPEDPTLLRLRGWLLFRQDKLAEAAAILEKSPDPLAQLCRARILLATGHAAQASTVLQDLWNTKPSGLLALQTALLANHPDFKAIRFTLAEPAGTQQVRPLVARLTPALANLHRQPQEALVIALNLRKPAVGLGEAALLQVRLTNALARAVPVGPDGMIKSSIGLAAAARAGALTPVGLYALEDAQRVFRLESHQMTETTIRVDQGRLADLFEQNPGTTYSTSVNVVVAPRVLSPTEFTVGLGGATLSAGEFQRLGLPLAALADVQRLISELATLSDERQLVRITAAASLLAPRDTPTPPAPGTAPATAGAAAPLDQIAAALAPRAQAGDPLVKAALLRALPPIIPAALEQALAPLAGDPDPLVRLLWARRQLLLGIRGPRTTAATLAALEKLSASEKDPLVSEWLVSAIALLPAPTTKP